MLFPVFLTDDAANGLEELYEYIATHDNPRRAKAWLAKVGRVVQRLSESPNRGTYPTELLALGIREYSQVFFKPYRIIYRYIENNVYVFLITDGRRDMRSSSNAAYLTHSRSPDSVKPETTDRSSAL